MATGTFEYRTDEERKAIERAIAFVAEMHDLALVAPAGHVLDQCEQQALDTGRDLLRLTLQDALQTRIDREDSKTAWRGDACAATPSTKNGGARGK